MINVFIDGSAGTTGLRIVERLSARADIHLMPVDEARKKDLDYRKEQINKSDVTFLCLPDDAARESASLLENPNTVLIDASTAHRTLPDWSYGFAELSEAHRSAIQTGKKIAVPGCHASGFIALVYPLIAKGLLSPDALLSCFSLTGYSGGGKGMIAEYEQDKGEDLFAPRLYGVSQSHKHLKEMKAKTGLANEPIFCPIVDDYYAGMEVSIPLFLSQVKGIDTAGQLQAFYEQYYADQPLVRPTRYEGNFISANVLAGKDFMQVGVVGNDERVVLIARFDNLGKGASGAAVQCMNLALGLDETLSLSL